MVPGLVRGWSTSKIVLTTRSPHDSPPSNISVRLHARATLQTCRYLGLASRLFIGLLDYLSIITDMSPFPIA